MTDRHHRFLNRLDKSVQWTGVPDLAAGKQRRRLLRWPPVLSLALATIGMALCLSYHQGHGYWIGYALIMLGFFMASILPIWGPLRTFGERADEFERQQRRDSFLVGLAAVAIAGLIGVWLTVGMLATQLWSATVARQVLTGLGFYMMVLWSAVPTLHASWHLKPLGGGD